MMAVYILSMCLIAYLTLNFVGCDVCCQINLRELPYYKLMKSNARSDQLILSRTLVQNVNECRKFAWTKKALAFNYGLEIDQHEWEQRVRNASVRAKMCQALQCPEIRNFTTLEKNKNYKYYSAYSGFISTGSAFTLDCIPKVGIFLFSNNKLNYSQAQTACQKMNASLAHIISEERTNGLGKYITSNTPTFIGLSNHNRETFWKNEFDEPLFCFNYRAWGMGEPSHSKGCVALVQPSESKPGPFWKVIPCSSILPFICEVSPMYPH